MKMDVWNSGTYKEIYISQILEDLEEVKKVAAALESVTNSPNRGTDAISNRDLAGLLDALWNSAKKLTSTAHCYRDYAAVNDRLFCALRQFSDVEAAMEEANSYGVSVALDRAHSRLRAEIIELICRDPVTGEEAYPG